MKHGLMIAAAVFLIAAGGASAQTDTSSSSAPPQQPAHPQAKTRGVHVIMPTEPDENAGGGAADQPPPPEPIPLPPPPPPPPPPPIAKCDRAFPQADLTFADQSNFDHRLHDLLARSDTTAVVIDVPGFAPDQAPGRLAAWFGQVSRTGGRVGRHDISCSRGFSFFRALSNLFNAPHEDIHDPAKDYDAVLWVEKTTDLVRQVQFVRRGTGS